MDNTARRFLVLLVLCIFVAGGGPGQSFADDEHGGRLFRIVQISDTQPSSGDEAAWKKAQQAVELVKRLKPDLVIFPGDITHSGTEAEYKRMKEMVDGIEAPVHLVPGNHDTMFSANDSESALSHEELRRIKLRLYREYFGEEAWTFERGDYLFVGWDCTETSSWDAAENLTSERRDWLETVLRESSKPYKVVVLHYQPPGPSTRLAKILNAHGVAVYMHGHLHRSEATVCAETGRLVLDSGSAVVIPAYGVLCLDVYPDVWRAAWHGVEGTVQELGEFNIADVLARVKRLPVFTKGPYVQDLTSAAATVKWETTAPPDSSVLYKKTGDADWASVANAPARILHEARLENLAPGTEYQYRVEFRSSQAGGVDSDEVTFRTPAEKPESVRFVVYGDTRSRPEGHARVVAAILERRRGRIDFVVHTGDLIADGNRYSRWGPEFFVPIRELAASIPVYPVLGNHEGNSENYFDLFALPGNERFYSRRFGPAHIWFLDSSWQLEPGSEQYEWFVSDIAASDAPWKFVVFHYPVFSSGPHGALRKDGTPVEAPIRHLWKHYVPLFEEHGVAMIFSGHDHVYERSEKGGVCYVTSGGGGAPLYEAQQNTGRNPRSKVLVTTKHHYCVIEADADSVEMFVFAPDGTLLDKVELSAERVP